MFENLLNLGSQWHLSAGNVKYTGEFERKGRGTIYVRSCVFVYVQFVAATKHCNTMRTVPWLNHPHRITTDLGRINLPSRKDMMVYKLKKNDDIYTYGNAPQMDTVDIVWYVNNLMKWRFSDYAVIEKEILYFSCLKK